ncbi:zinc finger protein 845-like [Mizuhopecten yessoensis]|uniref:Zinc finger protein 343 n=1 Tax=Mizuhopecten yessoensis TaxID=6573 RepID=A0A210PVP1_MIZYE|nr:zinc finger protein 845-like [Mizuhopecten yessoensis]OWF40536.1 Zinc finger protein 343 [Mizuhopecten yessoensis]
MADAQVCLSSPLLRPIPVYGQRETTSPRIPSLPLPPWVSTDAGLSLVRSCPLTAFMAVQNHLRQPGFHTALHSEDDKLLDNRTNVRDPVTTSNKQYPDVVTSSTYPFTLQPLLLRNRGQLISQFNVSRKLFPCPECRYTTDRRNNLKRHMLTMHRRCSKLMECCGVLFTTKASLREHSMIFHYHGYTCFYCGRRFCRKALLKRHLSVHNGQKDYVCPVCDYATSHKSNLERHRKIHVRNDDMSSPGGDCKEGKCDYSHISETGSDTGLTDESAMLSDCSDDEEIDVS